MKQKHKKTIFFFFFGNFLGTLGASLSGIFLSGKRVMRADEGTNKASHDF